MKKAGVFTPETKALAMTRAKGECELCGQRIMGNPHFHHRIPRGMGGTRDPRLSVVSNCMVLHLKCHERIERNRVEAFDNGWLCHRIEEPSMVVLLYKGRSWSNLREDGTVIEWLERDVITNVEVPINLDPVEGGLDSGVGGALPDQPEDGSLADAKVDGDDVAGYPV